MPSTVIQSPSPSLFCELQFVCQPNFYRYHAYTVEAVTMSSCQYYRVTNWWVPGTGRVLSTGKATCDYPYDRCGSLVTFSALILTSSSAILFGTRYYLSLESLATKQVRNWAVLSRPLLLLFLAANDRHDILATHMQVE